MKLSEVKARLAAKEPGTYTLDELRDIFPHDMGDMHCAIVLHSLHQVMIAPECRFDVMEKSGVEHYVITRAPVRLIHKIEDAPRVKFQTLPEALQRAYDHSACVHMHVSAFIHSRISREEMFEGLATAMVQHNELLASQLADNLKWFGAPYVVDSAKASEFCRRQ